MLSIKYILIISYVYIIFLTYIYVLSITKDDLKGIAQVILQTKEMLLYINAPLLSAHYYWVE